MQGYLEPLLKICETLKNEYDIFKEKDTHNQKAGQISQCVGNKLRTYRLFMNNFHFENYFLTVKNSSH
jgi:hypothetical protein